MSVFTPLTRAHVSDWLGQYDLGALHALDGIEDGVQNSNFFLDTAHGRYVLTVFEQLQRDELPFFIELMAHLSRHGVPCPAPVATHEGSYLGEIAGKPAVIVSRLSGRSPQTPTVAQCAAIGRLLATLHLAGQSCPLRQEHPRGPLWRQTTAEQLLPRLPAGDAALLASELRAQATSPSQALPRGIIHADLFRDNVLFAGDELSGVLDFYFAGVDDLLFDLAVASNDWCRDATRDSALDPARTGALLAAYHAVRPLDSKERDAWPMMLRAAALRFWLSRLADAYSPRDGELVATRDPAEYRALLCQHIAADQHQPWLDAVIA
ncbi:homoserine kinase [Rhodocyclus gracilis]|uniref:Homoserine kinase n=1 Tax=Rhodocyclus tenuis TaxID=1066 RepID=A0A6L5JZQ5_RHOTE|nr:homoserine kinase [Rhodocyclus gracilis]MQY52571.1 homoserine kinase [Rhodocyclus gracilis]